MQNNTRNQCKAFGREDGLEREQEENLNYYISSQHLPVSPDHYTASFIGMRPERLVTPWVSDAALVFHRIHKAQSKISLEKKI